MKNAFRCLIVPSIQLLCFAAFLRVSDGVFMGEMLGHPTLWAIWITGFVLILLTEEAAPYRLAIQKEMVALNLFCFVGMFFSLYFKETLFTTVGAPLTIAGLLFLGTALIGSGACFCIPPRDFFSRVGQLQFAVPLSFLAVSIFEISDAIRGNFEGPLTVFSGKSVAAFIAGLGVPVTSELRENSIRIFNQGVDMVIAPVCSGIGGGTFFTFLFLMLLMFERKRLFKPGTFGLFSIGIIWMLFVNWTRLVTLFLTTASISQTWDRTTGAKFFAWVGHPHLGWVAYAFGIALYAWMVFAWERQSLGGRQLFPRPAVDER